MNPFDCHEWKDEINRRVLEMDELSQQPKPMFSSVYQEKKAEFIAGQRAAHKKYRPLRKALIAIYTLVLFVILAACTTPLRDFMIKAYEAFTSYISVGTAYSISDLQIDLPHIPEAYTLAEETAQEHLSIIIYRLQGSDADDLRITIDSSSRKRSNLNHEGVSKQEFDIDGYPCILSRQTDQDAATLLCDFEYASVEIYSTALSDDELIQFAQKINITLKE